MFYDTGDRYQPLFIRPINARDGALPSGSSATTLAIMKVSRLTGNERLEQIAVKSLKTVRENMSQQPLSFANWLCALDFYWSNPKEIAVIGSRDNLATKDLLKVIFNTWLPNKVVAARDPQRHGTYG